MREARLTTDLIGAEDVTSLEDGWSRLFDETASDNFYVSFPWARACCEFAGKQGCEPAIAVARAGDRLVGVAPMQTAKYWPGGRTLMFLGPPRHDYGGFLVSPTCRDEATRALIQTLADRVAFDRVDLFGIREADKTMAVLRDDLGDRWPIRVEQPSASPYVELEGDFESYMASRPRHLRKRLKWAHNRVSRDGVSTTFWRRDAIEEETLEELYRIHIARHRARTGISKFEHEHVRRFNKLKSRLLADRGWLDVSGIEIDGRLAAFAYGVRLRNTYFDWTVGFDPDFARYSPGQLLFEYVLRTSYEAGLKRIDLMAGTEPYKYEWATGDAALYRLAGELPGFTLRHGLCAAAEAGRAGLKSVKDRSRLLQAMWRKAARIG